MNAKYEFVEPCGVKNTHTDEIEYYETSTQAKEEMEVLEKHYQTTPAFLVAQSDLARAIKMEEDVESGIYETTNQYGHPQTMQRDPSGEFPICSCCYCHVMPNRGQGTQCDACNHLDDMSFDYEYDEGIVSNSFASRSADLILQIEEEIKSEPELITYTRDELNAINDPPPGTDRGWDTLDESEKNIFRNGGHIPNPNAKTFSDLMKDREAIVTTPSIKIN